MCNLSSVGGGLNEVLVTTSQPLFRTSTRQRAVLHGCYDLQPQRGCSGELRSSSVGWKLKNFNFYKYSPYHTGALIEQISEITFWVSFDQWFRLVHLHTSTTAHGSSTKRLTNRPMSHTNTCLQTQACGSHCLAIQAPACAQLLRDCCI